MFHGGSPIGTSTQNTNNEIKIIIKIPRRWRGILVSKGILAYCTFSMSSAGVTSCCSPVSIFLSITLLSCFTYTLWGKIQKKWLEP